MITKPTLNQIRPFYQYLRQQAENKKIAKYLEITATFTLITIFLLLAIKPTALAISSLVGEIKSKELASQKMHSKINSIIQAQDSFSQAQEKYFILESGFPSNPNFYQAAVNFYTISKESSINIKQLNFNISNIDDSKKEKSLTKSFQIDITANSQYQSTLSFIKGLLNNRRLVDISSIRFSRPDDKNQTSNSLNSGFVNLNISSNLFYSPIESK
ncbi:MAG: hypothetical protein PHX34_00950 [Candidatus Shapirobacteria bacterium]|nr:hypothetical protein [Candidatus Shapirobacteria bacterium]